MLFRWWKQTRKFHEKDETVLLNVLEGSRLLLQGSFLWGRSVKQVTWSDPYVQVCDSKQGIMGCTWAEWSFKQNKAYTFIDIIEFA
jgi:hypothetical protein